MAGVGQTRYDIEDALRGYGVIASGFEEGM
jgi:hypothetical protein